MLRYFIIFTTIFNTCLIQTSEYGYGGTKYTYGVASIDNASEKENPLIFDVKTNRILVPISILPINIASLINSDKEHLLISIDNFKINTFCCCGGEIILKCNPGDLIRDKKNRQLVLDNSFKKLPDWYQETLEERYH